MVRDWGWAPDYVDAMWRMLQQPEPSDFVIATGRSHRLADFVAHCFAARGLQWRDHVELDLSELRPSEIAMHHADPRRARNELGWTASTGMEEMARRLVSSA